MMNVDIAGRLSRKRKDHGLSQEELAEQLGVSRQAVSKWERSESSPDTDNLIALARLYGVSIDELLYADDAAAACPGGSSAHDQAEGSRDSSTKPEGAEESTSGDARDQGFDVTGDSGEKVHMGPGGIHVVDGDDYVHVSWRDGVHVKNDKDGEVHVGWNGIHVTDSKKKGKVVSDDDATSSESDGPAGFYAGPGGVVINGERFDNWKEARDSWKHHDHHDTAWARFPYPVLALLVFLFAGLFWNAWNPGWVILLTIPLYYTLGTAISERRIAPFLLGLYPTVCVGWFFYMAMIVDQANPAWLIFLTIPLVEWFIVAVSRWWTRLRRRRQVTDVEPETPVTDGK